MGNNFAHGTIGHKEQHKENLINNGCTFVNFDVQCKRFCDICDTPVDLFILDVEGHELEALDGILPVKPRILVVEFPIVGLNNIHNMVKNNYTFDGVYYNNAYYVSK